MEKPPTTAIRWVEPAVIIAFVSLLFFVFLYAVDSKIGAVDSKIGGLSGEISSARKEIDLLRQDIRRTFDRLEGNVKDTDQKIDGLKDSIITGKIISQKK